MSEEQHQAEFEVPLRPLLAIRSRVVSLILCTVLLVAGSCSNSSTELSDEWSDNWAAVSASQNTISQLEEFSVGVFCFTIPTRGQDIDYTAPGPTARLRFELHALIQADDRKTIEDALEKHRGDFHNALLRICRKADWNELADPMMVFIKTNLRDASDRILGRYLVRGFTITHLELEEQ